MKVLTATTDHIAQAAKALRDGDLVAMPTETVYGLAGDAHNSAAIQKIYATKGRPQHNPLILHVADMDAAEKYGAFNDNARALASVFWPGPLTLVVSRRADDKTSEPLASCFLSLETLAIRIPAHAVAQALLREFGGAIAAPSANLSGQLSPSQVDHVARAFSEKDQPKIILAGGRTDTGLESTIVDCTDALPKILRPGSITHEQLCAVVENILPFDPQAKTQTITAPGQLEKHYAPQKKLRLNVAEIMEGEALLAFGPEPLWVRRAVMLRNLSPDGDLTQAAQNLFTMLHELDQSVGSGIAVMPIPAQGPGVAINDRLRRGAMR